MTTGTARVFYIGNYADIDITELDPTDATDTPEALLGTYSTLQSETVTLSDPWDVGFVSDDNLGGLGDITYDVGSGPTTSEIDSTVTYNAAFLLDDATVLPTSVVVFQLANGDTFVSEYAAGASLDNLNIQSITLTSVIDDEFLGYNFDQSAEGASVVCFAAGTRIETPGGEVLVQDLRTGDQVHTADNGPQPIVWMHRWQKRRAGDDAPVLFEPGFFENGTPVRRLALSPQHRVLISSAQAKRSAGHRDMLVAAKHLLDFPGAVAGNPDQPVSYVHFACASHELVFANGMATETFYPNNYAMSILSKAARERFPDHLVDRMRTNPVRPIPKHQVAREILGQHGNGGSKLRQETGRTHSADEPRQTGAQEHI